MLGRVMRSRYLVMLRELGYETGRNQYMYGAEESTMKVFVLVLSGKIKLLEILLALSSIPSSSIITKK